MAELVLNNMKKIYGKDTTAVENFNLHIKDKDFIVFVGPSGCGKSTMLRMIAGLEEISEGEFYIDGKLMNDVASKDRDIAMVFQNYALYPHMNVFDNMAFGLKQRKFKKEDIRNRVESAAKTLGLEDFLDRKPKALSGGQRQRVALGRAIVRDPKVFLMDEPLSNLDAKLRVQMRAEIQKLHHRLQTTTVYVTHDQTEAMTMATRIVVLNNGQIQQVGTPKEIYDSPANMFVGGFIGSPAMNFLHGKISEGFIHFGDVSIKISDAKAKLLKINGYENKEIILGIRPEDIHDVSDIKETPPHSTVTFHVEVAELIGAETIIYGNLNGQTLISRIDAAKGIITRSKVTMMLNMEKAHFFHPETGVRI